jgi:hypothetical protein
MILMFAAVQLLLLVCYQLASRNPARLTWTIAILLGTSLLYLVSTTILMRKSPPRNLVLAAAFLFRLAVLPGAPPLSDDLHRYRWEGLVQAHGHNPYLVRPSDANLVPLSDPKVPAPDFKAGYGPLTEILQLLTYRAAAAVSSAAAQQVWFFKLPAVLADTATLFLLPQNALLWYAWSPLVIVEFWGNGHNDALTVLLLTLAFTMTSAARWNFAFLALGAAVAVKFWPLILAPLFLRHSPSRRLALLTLPVPLVCALPYLTSNLAEIADSSRFMTGFLGGWRNNDSIYGLLLWLAGDIYLAKYAAFALLALAVGIIARRQWPLEHAALAAVAALLVLSANVHPWYLTWLFPMLAFVPWPPLLLWASMMPLAYTVLFEWRSIGVWNGSAPVRFFIYVPVFLALVIFAFKDGKRV